MFLLYMGILYFLRLYKYLTILIYFSFFEIFNGIFLPRHGGDKPCFRPRNETQKEEKNCRLWKRFRQFHVRL